MAGSIIKWAAGIEFISIRCKSFKRMFSYFVGIATARHPLSKVKISVSFVRVLQSRGERMKARPQIQSCDCHIHNLPVVVCSPLVRGGWLELMLPGSRMLRKISNLLPPGRIPGYALLATWPVRYLPRRTCKFLLNNRCLYVLDFDDREFLAHQLSPNSRNLGHVEPSHIQQTM